MKKISGKKKLIVGITGKTKKDWQEKLNEIRQYGVTEVALYMEYFTPRQRTGLFNELVNSPIKKIPLVHIQTNTTKQEIKFLKQRFGSKYFTIHEAHFPILERWQGYYRDLFLETNFDDAIAPYVDVKKIGGFCIDLAHYKVAVTKQVKEYRYTVEEINNVGGICNHLSGYSPKTNLDNHFATNIRDFDFVYSLPRNIFGNVIALEVFCSIHKQLQFQRILINELNKNGFNISTPPK